MLTSEEQERSLQQTSIDGDGNVVDNYNVVHIDKSTTFYQHIPPQEVTPATHLLECLDVAYVTDREAIEDRLLRPPRKDDHAG
jgi:hypothetical protein